jgi:hypothetical protein
MRDARAVADIDVGIDGVQLRDAASRPPAVDVAGSDGWLDGLGAGRERQEQGGGQREDESGRR